MCRLLSSHTMFEYFEVSPATSTIETRILDHLTREETLFFCPLQSLLKCFNYKYHYHLKISVLGLQYTMTYYCYYM